jgi:predicted ABC-class ATPase
VEQSAVSVDAETGDVTVQFTVNLPACGRIILGQAATEIFQHVVPQFVQKSLIYSAFDGDCLQHHIFSVEDQQWVRSQLPLKGLIAFVPNGAILPQVSGADNCPMEYSKDQNVIPFQSPKG